MAEPDQLKKETVRIELPLPPLTEPPESSAKPLEAVRIKLPVRESDNHLIPFSPVSNAGSAAGNVSSTNSVPQPKAPAGSPPLSTSMNPPSLSAAPSFAVAPTEKKSMLLYWLLLGVSALILIIQIWIYIS